MKKLPSFIKEELKKKDEQKLADMKEEIKRREAQAARELCHVSSGHILESVITCVLRICIGTNHCQCQQKEKNIKFPHIQKFSAKIRLSEESAKFFLHFRAGVSSPRSGSKRIIGQDLEFGDWLQTLLRG